MGFRGSRVRISPSRPSLTSGSFGRDGGFRRAAPAPRPPAGSNLAVPTITKPPAPSVATPASGARRPLPRPPAGSNLAVPTITKPPAPSVATRSPMVGWPRSAGRDPGPERASTPSLSEPITPHPALRTQHSALRTQHAALSTQHPTQHSTPATQHFTPPGASTVRSRGCCGSAPCRSCCRRRRESAGRCGLPSARRWSSRRCAGSR